MNKLIAVGIVAAFLVACLPLCISIMDDTEADESIPADMSADARSIVVLTDQPMVMSSPYDDNVRFQSTFESIGADDIVVIDGLWIENQDQSTVYGDVKSLIDGGIPILLVADSYDAISSDKIGYSTGFSPSADVYGIMVDPVSGAVCCYSVSSLDISSSFESALRWIDDHESDFEQA